MSSESESVEVDKLFVDDNGNNLSYERKCATHPISSFGKAVTDTVKSTVQEILVMLLELLALIILPCLFLLTSPKCLTRYFCAL